MNAIIFSRFWDGSGVDLDGLVVVLGLSGGPSRGGLQEDPSRGSFKRGCSRGVFFFRF